MTSGLPRKRTYQSGALGPFRAITGNEASASPLAEGQFFIANDFQPKISAGNYHTNGSSTSTLNSRNGWHPARNQSDLGPVSFDADRKPRLFGARYQVNRTSHRIYCAIIFCSCW